MTNTRVPTDMAQALSPGQRQSLEHFYGALGAHDVDLVDQALTSDWEDIPLASGQAAAPKGLKPIFRMLITAFPDLSAEITEVLAEAGRAAVRVSVTGTHRGDLFGVPASGKSVRFALHEFHEFEGDRLRRTYHMEDLFGLFTQIGAWPSLDAGFVFDAAGGGLQAKVVGMLRPGAHVAAIVTPVSEEVAKARGIKADYVVKEGTRMEKRALGKSGIEIPPLVFGGNVFGWTADEAASFRLLDALLDAGFNAIDTADLYSTWVPGHQGGESEAIIGKWLKQRGGRDKVLIFTKVGMPMGSGGKGLSKRWITEEVEHSLSRLQTDYIDLYQSHLDDEETPLEETLDAYASLIKQGKVRAIGASNYSAPRLKQALETSARLGLPRYESLQPHYSLVEREVFEKDLEPLCQAERLGVINYYPLASGFLTGKYRSEADLSKSLRGERVRQYLNARGERILKALEEVAANHAATPAQVALAWLIARPAVTAPIASATSVDQLQELVKAASLKPTPGEIEALNQASGY